jgi:peroxiredoxin
MGSGKRVVMKVNSLAPIFELTDIFDRTINLKDYRGKRVLIGFFRHAGCPFCNTRVHRLETRYKELKEMGLEMIFFFESDKETLLGNDFHRGVSPIPIISDPAKQWYDRYGVEESAMASAKSHLTSFFSSAIRAKLNKLPVHWMKGNESINTLPAEFLIDEYGVVQKLLYCKRLNQRLGMETIEDFAKEFQDNKWGKGSA